MRSFPVHFLALLSFLFSCSGRYKTNETNSKVINELNQTEIARGEGTIALTGATLIDGTGAAPVNNALVIVKNNVIDYAGPMEDRRVPEGAEIVDVRGLTLLPGLIDAHYHNDYSQV